MFGSDIGSLDVIVRDSDGLNERLVRRIEIIAILKKENVIFNNDSPYQCVCMYIKVAYPQLQKYYQTLLLMNIGVMIWEV